MVVKGEHISLDGNLRNNYSYVFMDYRKGVMQYHSTQLIIGTNMQLQALS